MKVKIRKNMKNKSYEEKLIYLGPREQRVCRNKRKGKEGFGVVRCIYTTREVANLQVFLVIWFFTSILLSKNPSNSGTSYYQKS